MTVSFEVRTTIAATPQAVFDLSLDIDEHLASMADSGERAVAGITAGHISLGEEVTWKATHFAIPFTMTSRITELDAPHRFVDEQVHGPFKTFHHEHCFEPTASGTTMLDRVRLVAPVGPVGTLVERLLLGRYLQHLIEERARHLKAVAEQA